MTRRPVLLAAALLAGVMARAAEPTAACPGGTIRLDRGETRRILLCGAALEGVRAATDAAGLRVDYQQPLRQCSPDRPGPGLYLTLTATAEAGPGSLVMQGATGAAACPALAIEVPARRLLAPGRLIEVAGDRHELVVRVPRGHDLSAACADGVELPASSGPRLAMAPGSVVRCNGRRLRALVDVTGEQREPAPVVIRNVRDPEGVPYDAISWVGLPRPGWADAMPESSARFVMVNGVRTRYFEAGRGHPLLLVHGGQAGGTNNEARKWDQNWPGLARQFRVIALDRLGQGATGNPVDPADYGRLYAADAEHLLGFIRALQLERVHLVGHSQGGYPVTRIAVDHPELVSCLVNVDTGIVPDSMAIVKQTLPFLTYLSTTAVPEGGPVPESIRREITLRTPSGHNITDEHVARIHALWQSPSHREAREATRAAAMTPAGNYYRSLKAALLADLGAGRLAVPSLLVWGGQDPQVPFAAGLELFAILNRGDNPSELAVIDNAGHEVFMEYPGAFNRIVAGFCGPRR
jgi:2-hydroxy-6-oxo-6-(2'-carboxyphenyl)-hexa-2,4-dienoate hydrolase